MTPITIDRWKEAQLAERSLHKMGFNEGIGHYYWAYRNYFQYLGIELDQRGKFIIEVGPADVPALMFCECDNGVIIEPMQSGYLIEVCLRRGLRLVSDPVEILDLPTCSEIWLLNVLQHVIDPDLFVSKCKNAAETIRFFEPINQPVCTHHPHTFTKEDFERWYGEVSMYTDRLPGFFDDDCVYGIWRKY